jgi:DUF4097 and DUF4098 domain-containing protein YvlB
MIRKSIFLSLCIATFFAIFIVNLVRADTETFDETYEVNSGIRFEIHNLNGSVNIQGWDHSQIRVHAIKKTYPGGKLENVRIQVSQGADFKIETIQIVKNPRVSVNYDLRVPVSVVVKLVRTFNGKIEVKDVVGDIDARTSNGPIEIKDVMGFVSAHTSNGTIKVDGVAGVVKLETSNGAIETEVPAIGENGLRVHTSNGAIALSLASDLNVDLEARTSNGKIKLDDLEMAVKEITRNTLRGKLGKGGKKILCRTSNGNIVLKKLK